jgi:eukaryotic-like serine/threonine-protein kinase
VSSEHDLLFGVLAVQLGFASPRQVMAAGAAWAADRSKSLSERLENDGVVTAERCEMLKAMVAEAVKVHGGDPKKTLTNFGGQEAVFMSFGGSIFVSEDGEVKQRQKGSAEDEEDEDTLKVTPEYPARYSFGGKGAEEQGTKDSAEIGRGGIGRVLVAYDQHLSREIALKELLPEKLTGGRLSLDSPMQQVSTVVSRFLREARVTGQLEHPNIVPVYELGHRKDGSYYYTMKLVRGRTLEDALEECKTLPERMKLLGHFTDLCQAIAYTHSRGVVHRDIKPDNVMVGEFGETVVLDWGLAKVHGKKDIRGKEIERELKLLHEALDGKTADGDAIGTPMYMSPEQADGRISDIDERSDVWSLGVVLFHILTGDYPWEGATPFEIVANVLTKEPRKVLDVTPNAPAELASVVDKALAVEPGKRYQGAKEVANEVVAFQTGGKVTAYEYSPWELVKRFAAQNKGPIIVAAVFLVMLISLAVGSYVQIIKEKNRAVDAEKVAQVARTDAEKRERESRKKLASALVEKANYSKTTGEAMLFAAGALAQEERPDMRGILVGKANEPHPVLRWQKTITQGERERNCKGITFSSDGNRLQCITNHNGLFIWDLESGNEILRKTEYPGPVYSAAFSLDGSMLALENMENVALVFDVQSGKTVRSYREANVISALLLSPDNKLLIVMDSEGVIAKNIDSGKEILLHKFEKKSFSKAIAYSRDGKLLAFQCTLKSVCIKDIESQKLVKYETQLLSLAKMLFSMDGETLALEDKEHNIALMNVANGERKLLGKNSGRQRLVGFVSNSAAIVTLNSKSNLNIWDLKSGELKDSIFVGAGEKSLAVLSRDEKKAAIYGSDESLCIWDLKTKSKVNCHMRHLKSVFTNSFSPDGGKIAIGGADCSIRIFDTNQGNEKHWFKGLDSWAMSVAFSPDGKYLAAGLASDQIIAWNAEDYREISRILEKSVGARSVFFDKEGKNILVKSLDSLTRWNFTSGETSTSKFKENTFSQTTLGSRVVISSVASGRYKIKSLVHNTETIIEPSKKAAIVLADFSPDGTVLATVNENELIQVWEADSGTRLVEYSGPQDDIMTIVFSPNGKLLLAGDKAGSINLWGVHEVKSGLSWKAHDNWVFSISVSPDNTLLSTVSMDGTVKLWELPAGVDSDFVRVNDAGVASLDWNLRAKLIATGGIDGVVRVLDSASGKVVLNELKGHDGIVNAIVFAPDGSQLYSGGEDGKLISWNINEANQKNKHHDIGSAVLALDTLQTRRSIVIGTADGSILLFDLEKQKIYKRIKGHADGVFTVAVSPDGNVLASGGGDGVVRTWSLENLAEISKLSGHTDKVFTVLFSPDGKRLVSGGRDGVDRLWDLETALELRAFKGHNEWVSSVSISPDGNSLAVGGGDRVIRLLDTNTMKETARLAGQEEDVTAVSFTHDGKGLLSVSLDGTLKHWDLELLGVDPAKAMKHVEQEFGLALTGMNVSFTASKSEQVDAAIVYSKSFFLYEEAVLGFLGTFDGSHSKITMSKEGPFSRPEVIAATVRELKPRVIVTLGLRATKSVTSQIDDIPIVFMMAMNPIKNELKRENSTGVDLEPHPKTQLTVIMETIPGLKRIGVIYDPKRTGRFVEELRKAANNLGIELIARPVKARKETNKALDEIIDKIDAYWIHRDATVLTREFFNHLVITQEEKNIPLIGYSKQFVKMGATISFSAAYRAHGTVAADLVNRILAGEHPSKIPLHHPTGNLTLNTSAIEKSGKTFPKYLMRRQSIELVKNKNQ